MLVPLQVLVLYVAARGAWGWRSSPQPSPVALHVVHSFVCLLPFFNSLFYLLSSSISSFARRCEGPRRRLIGSLDSLRFVRRSISPTDLTLLVCLRCPDVKSRRRESGRAANQKAVSLTTTANTHSRRPVLQAAAAGVEAPLLPPIQLQTKRGEKKEKQQLSDTDHTNNCPDTTRQQGTRTTVGGRLFMPFLDAPIGWPSKPEERSCVGAVLQTIAHDLCAGPIWPRRSWWRTWINPATSVTAKWVGLGEA